MRALHVVCSFVLSLLVEETVFAQVGEPTPASGPTSAGKSAEQAQEIKKRSADWFKTCLGDWDEQTHMSKAEWRTTCKRVSKEREQFYLNTPGALSVGERALR